MSLRTSRAYSAPVPKMPPGLVELMEGLARDVLKNNPTDVYAFCAGHMQKLLQIRDGSTIKSLPTLNQKVVNATKKIRDRAAQRRDKYDKGMQLLQLSESKTNANQYIKENIVKIPQNVLTCKVEHEITTGLHDEKKFLPEISYNNTSDTNMKDNIISSKELQNVTYEDPHPTAEHNIKKTESLEIDLDSKDFANNGQESLNSIDEDKILIIIKAQSDENLSMQSAVIDGEEADINLSDSNHIEDKFILPVDEVIKDNNQGPESVKNPETIKPKEIINSLENVELSKVAVREEEHNDNKNSQDILKKNNQNEAINHFETILEDAQNDENRTLIDNKDDKIDIENKGEENDKISDTNINDVKGQEPLFNNHSNSMDLETAAITIQKVFRAFLFRNKTLSVDDSTTIDMNLLIEDKEKKHNQVTSNNSINKDRRPLGVNRMDTVLQTVNEEKSLSLSTDDSSTLSSAATIIQAHVRGFLVRNNIHFNKTASSTSGIDSDGQSMTSLDGDTDYRKNKTVLNIHIVPEGGHFMSRDESMLTSMDLSLDGSPPNSINLHPLGYDKSERRKLKREDAVQSLSPPSCNSGKLSEDFDSVKEIFIDNVNDNLKCEINETDIKAVSSPLALNDDNISTMMNTITSEDIENIQKDITVNKSNQLKTLSEITSDEMDVVTPFVTVEGTVSSELVENNIKLMHSGECHDVVLPTKVSRNDTSVVRGE